MHQFISDILEYGSTGLVRWVNRRCGPERLPGEEIILDVEEILSLYPPESTFRPCLEQQPLRWGASYPWRGLEVRDFAVASLFQPVAPFQKAYEGMAENLVIHGQRFRMAAGHRKGPPTCLLYCHGWSGRSYSSEMRWLFPATLHRAPQIDVYAMQLPYHMLRKPRQAPFSGSLYFDGVPVRNIEAIRQGASDLSQLLGVLRDRYERVIVAGTSLGGFTVSFLTISDPRADAYAIVQAGGDLTTTCTEVPLAPCFQRRWERLGWSVGDVQALYEPVRWGRYRPVVDGNRVIVVAGEYDRIVPVETVREMCRALGVKHAIYYPGGHMSIGIFGRRIFDQVMRVMPDVLSSRNGEVNSLAS